MDRMKQQGGTRLILSQKTIRLRLLYPQPWTVLYQPFCKDDDTSHGNTIAPILKKDWLDFLINAFTHKRENHAPTA